MQYAAICTCSFNPCIADVASVQVLVVHVAGALRPLHATPSLQKTLIFVLWERYVKCSLTWTHSYESTNVHLLPAQAVRAMNECPALLQPTPSTTSYHLHINVPTEIRPPLILQTVALEPIEQLFNDGLFECVVCTGDCETEESIIFRLQASIFQSSDEMSSSQIECHGNTVTRTPE